MSSTHRTGGSTTRGDLSVANATAIADTYLAAYGEPDFSKRAVLVEQVWAPDGRLIDPPVVASGHVQIHALAEGALARYPGHRFRRTSGVDAHHDRMRFAWELVSPDGFVALAGIDFGEVGDDGRLRTMTGFFGGLSAREVTDDS